MSAIQQAIAQEYLKIANLWRRNAEIKHGVLPFSQDGLTQIEQQTEPVPAAPPTPPAPQPVLSSPPLPEIPKPWSKTSLVAGALAAAVAGGGLGAGILGFNDLLHQDPSSTTTTIVEEGEQSTYDYLIDRGLTRMEPVEP